MHAPRSSRRSTAPNMALWSGRVVTWKGREEIRAARRSRASSTSLSGCAAVAAAAAAAVAAAG